MDHLIKSWKGIIHDIGPIVFRNAILLTNLIIYAVVVLLLVFHQIQAGLFLATTIVVAIAIGIVQEVRARLALEKLQLLTALRFVRLNSNGTQETVLAEELQKGDRIKLKFGDQIPCDGILLSTRGLEVSNALLTGESESFAKPEGDKVLAGGIISSGSGLMRVEAPFAQSRISQMAKDIKKYSTNFSPIQKSISIAIKYSGYLLMVVIIFVVVRGLIVDEGTVRIIKNVGALTSLLVPQGLVLATTILFAYGAVSLLRKHVLMQEINATEKLGRIKNLCVDKTGTLTENILVVEDMFVPAGSSKPQAQEQTLAYLHGSDDSSETILAVKKFLGGTETSKITQSITFSSLRRYGAVPTKTESGDAVILVGASEVFLPHFSEEEQEWLKELLQTHTRDGKRLLCVARMKGKTLPEGLLGVRLSLVAVFVFYNKLRPGIQEVISFFQEREVIIRVISGDNPATVHAVAVLAGINNAEAIVTGPEIEKWSEADFARKTSDYTIFARINPEQKEKIIAGFKKSGFTAMVGDGANDALALKKADLGIAMFDGAPATRKLAAVVLMNNSFFALPDGVRFADSIIRNIEILASLFFNQVTLGFLFFVILSVGGFAFPFTPLNITFIDYFSIGFPSMLVFYWAIVLPSGLHLNSRKSFLRRVLPFAVWSAVVQAAGAAAVFALSPQYLKMGESNTLLAVIFIILDFMFFIFTPSVYQGRTSRAQKMMFAGFAVFEIVLLYIIFKIPLLMKFFDITYLSGISIVPIAVLLGLCLLAQFLLAIRFSKLEKIIN